MSAKQRKRQPGVGRSTFSPVLDQQSENILYLLSLDSRRNLREVGRKLGLTDMQIHYRIRKLRDMGAIRYATLVNAPIGFRFTLLLRLKFVTDDLIGRLKEHSDICILRQTTGEYDLHIVCDVKSEKECKGTLTKIKRICGGNLTAIEMLPHKWMLSLGYKSFCHEIGLLEESTPVKPLNRDLTEEEGKVLQALRKNPTTSYRKLKPSTGVHYNFMEPIVEGLRRDGLMQSIVFMNYSMLGLEYHHMALRVAQKGRKKFEQYIWKHPRIHFVKATGGCWDYILSIASRSVDEFIRVSQKIRSDNVQSITDSTTILSVLRHSWADVFPHSV